jgi:FAD:protein FMN transferase
MSTVTDSATARDTATFHRSLGVPGSATADFRALGTGVRVVVTDPGMLAGALAAVRSRLDRIDAACSRFRADSDLTAVNAAAGEPARVGPDLLDALAVALRAADLTDGRVDPTLGRHLASLGYDRDFALVRGGRVRGGTAAGQGGATTTVTRRPGWRGVEVDRDASTVRIPAGTALDLGATAKARAVDLAVSAAAATGAGGVLVSAGGDIAVAGPAPAGGWPVLVTDDHAAPTGAPGERVTIRAGALATSSTTVRRWSRGGHTLHHLLDPATLRPAESAWRTVTVAAGSCVDANTASTAAIVLGWPAREWLAARDLPARLVTAGGDVVRVAGWPGGELR